MSPHRDQEGTAIRHALYRPVCTCGWRGFSGCVRHAVQKEACTCALWEQRWMPHAPHVCSRCGGPFNPKTVPARVPSPGDPFYD